MLDQVQRLASFSNGDQGGNPAGVWIGAALPSADQMQAIAAQVGYSETAFAAKQPDGAWRVRYFAPLMEVPFCGHATIALGAALAMREGDATFTLALNETSITVDGKGTQDGSNNNGAWAALQSPPTHSTVAPSALVAEVLALFGLSRDDLDPRIQPTHAHAGADHFVLPLNSRPTLAAMAYDFDAGKALMDREGWVTIALVFAEADQSLHVRNAFAAGGVVEDPATGAAAAALSGALRDQGWPHGGMLHIAQGDDMGLPSRITSTFGEQTGSSIRVAGIVRHIA